MIKNDLFIADHRVGLAVDHPVGGLGEILGAEDGTADSPGFEKFPGKITFLHGDGFALEIREGGDTGLFRPDKNRSRHLEQRPGKRKPRDPLFTVKQAGEHIRPPLKHRFLGLEKTHVDELGLKAKFNRQPAHHIKHHALALPVGGIGELKRRVVGLADKDDGALLPEKIPFLVGQFNGSGD